MKSEIRLLGIDDAPHDRNKKGDVLVVGTVFRGGTLLDCVLSTKVKIDGDNSTSKIIAMVNKLSKKPHAILLDGIAFGGFNIIDIQKLNHRTKLPVIIVIRRYPNFTEIKNALKKMGKEESYKLIENAGKVHKVGKIYVQFVGIKLDEVKDILNLCCTRSLIPEPIRIAHIIAAGITTGVSKGNA